MKELSTGSAHHCRKCGAATWQTSWAGIHFQLDTQPLDLTAELNARLNGRPTYEARPNRQGGFTAIRRWREHILDADQRHRIILAEHQCTTNPDTTHPHYWPTPTTTKTDTDGMPF